MGPHLDMGASKVLSELSQNELSLLQYSSYSLINSTQAEREGSDREDRWGPRP